MVLRDRISYNDQYLLLLTCSRLGDLASEWFEAWNPERGCVSQTVLTCPGKRSGRLIIAIHFLFFSTYLRQDLLDSDSNREQQLLSSTLPALGTSRKSSVKVHVPPQLGKGKLMIKIKEVTYSIKTPPPTRYKNRKPSVPCHYKSTHAQS